MGVSKIVEENNQKEQKYKTACQMLLVLFMGIMLVYFSGHDFNPSGEWRSYVLPTISFINDGDFTLSHEDFSVACEWLPEWEPFITEGGFSVSPTNPFHTKNGDVIPWYFFTYSLFCVPVMLFLKFLGLSLTKTWCLANTIFYVISLYIVYMYANTNYKNKLLLLLLLIVNPCLYYFRWTSAEVFISSFVIMALTYWSKKLYKPAAFSASIAASMNPVLLLLCLAVGISFLVNMCQNNSINGLHSFMGTVKKNLFCLIRVGICFIPAIVPLIYNLCLVGNINITASAGYASFHYIPQRFLAYLFDLNYGYFPYFSFVLISYFVVFAASLYYKMFNAILQSILFLFVIMGYCLIGHINCGMTGIARYSVWGSPIMVFVVIMYYEKVFQKKMRKIIGIMVILTIIASGGLLEIYYNNLGLYTSFTPLAVVVLDFCPIIYSPLHSTFNSRVNHVDGGYSYTLPIYYTDTDDYARKILVDPFSVDTVRTSLLGSTDDMEWLNQKLNAIKKEEYISIPRNRKLAKVSKLEEDNTIWFSGDNWNANEFIREGVSHSENTFTWTDRNDVAFSFAPNKYDELKQYKISIYIDGTYNGAQNVIISENGQELYNNIILPETKELTFNVHPVNGVIRFHMLIPNAISPYELNQSADRRELGVRLVKAVLEID